MCVLLQSCSEEDKLYFHFTVITVTGKQLRVLHFIYFQRDDIGFLVLEFCDEIRGDVGPALLEQVVSPVLSSQERNTISR